MVLTEFPSQDIPLNKHNSLGVKVLRTLEQEFKLSVEKVIGEHGEDFSEVIDEYRFVGSPFEIAKLFVTRIGQ